MKKVWLMLLKAVLLSNLVIANLEVEDDNLPPGLWSIFNWKIGRLLDYDSLFTMNKRFNDIVQITTDYQGFKEAQNQKLNEKFQKSRLGKEQAEKPLTPSGSVYETQLKSDQPETV